MVARNGVGQVRGIAQPIPLPDIKSKVRGSGYGWARGLAGDSPPDIKGASTAQSVWTPPLAFCSLYYTYT